MLNVSAERDVLQGHLYLVGTPIGNLQDMTYRAVETLRQVAMIACEDKRVTQTLVQAYSITTPLLSYHDHNAAQRRPQILEKLRSGQSIALVSDAGMPLISDPGYKLVAACLAEGFTVTVIPGASAVLTALCGAGLPTDRFFFQGFLPVKTGARTAILQELATLSATLIFFEAPHRIYETLCVLQKILGHRRAALSRELTKKFEETVHGTLEELAVRYKERPPRGEITLIVEGASQKSEIDQEMLDALITDTLQTASLKETVETICQLTALPRRLVYPHALKIKAALSKAKV